MNIYVKLNEIIKKNRMKFLEQIHDIILLKNTCELRYNLFKIHVFDKYVIIYYSSISLSIWLFKKQFFQIGWSKLTNQKRWMMKTYYLEISFICCIIEHLVKSLTLMESNGYHSNSQVWKNAGNDFLFYNYTLINLKETDVLSTYLNWLKFKAN